MLELAEDFSNSELVSDMELTSDLGCLEMYKQFTCRYNFPLCDLETGKSEKVCPNECLAFHNNCGLPGANMCSSRFFENIEEESPSCEFAPEIEVEEEEEE